MPTLQFHNKIIEEVWAHPEVHRLQQAGEVDQANALLAHLRGDDGAVDISGFVLLERFSTHNINVRQGKTVALNLIAGTVTNANGWFLAPYSSAAAPTSDWTADLVASGVTEFTSYSGTDPAGGRQAINFDLAVDPGTGDRVEITNSVRAEIDVTADETIYGVCVISESTKNTAAGNLLAAVHYGTPKAYTNGQRRYLGYQIYIP